MIEWLSGWYNWPFLFPMALAAIFVLFDVLLGGLSELIGGSGHLHVDADVDIDLDVDVDTDVDVDAPEIGAAAGHSPGAFLSGLMWLGLGKVPISIILEVLFISFGGIGLLVNALWSEVAPASMVWLSLPLAVVLAFTGALFITKWTAIRISRLVPSDASMSRGAGGFMSELGVVVSTVSPGAGQIRVEGRGNTPDAILNVKLDAHAPQVNLSRGTKVVVMDYIESKNTYTVTPMEEL